MTRSNIHIPPSVYEITCRTEENFFPEIRPFNEGYLQVSPFHQLWYAQYGNPQGTPVLVVHGGPGAGCTPNDMRFFDPNFYHIILLDQRGSNHSQPCAELTDNTTDYLIADMEFLRKHISIDQWMLFGGSWGSALSLAYGQTHPDHCLGFVLRGIFLGRKREFEQVWYGMRDMYPEAWKVFIDYLPENERNDLIKAYYKRLMDPNIEVYMPAARAFTKYDLLCSTLVDNSRVETILKNDRIVLGLAKCFTHYCMNAFFFKPEQLVDNLHKIAHLPCIIVHGRYDVICRPSTAFELHEKWPGSKLILTSVRHKILRSS